MILQYEGPRTSKLHKKTYDEMLPFKSGIRTIKKMWSRLSYNLVDILPLLIEISKSRKVTFEFSSMIKCAKVINKSTNSMTHFSSSNAFFNQLIHHGRRWINYPW